MSVDEESQERQLNIHVDPQHLGGVYSNFANISFSDYEFAITFARIDHEVEEGDIPGVVVARQDLLKAVWATDFVPDSTHVVDVHLANLRRKLRAASADNQWIRTIRGVGFRFDPCCP